MPCRILFGSRSAEIPLKTTAFIALTGCSDLVNYQQWASSLFCRICLSGGQNASKQETTSIKRWAWMMKMTRRESFPETNQNESDSWGALWFEVIGGIFMVAFCAYLLTSYRMLAHLLDGTGLEDLPERWKFVIGTAISVFGVCMGIFFVRRSTRRLRQKRQKNGNSPNN
jgi:hypothetical protein